MQSFIRGSKSFSIRDGVDSEIAEVRLKVIYGVRMTKGHEKAPLEAGD